MPSRYYANGQSKTLTAGITNVATTVPVSNVTGLPTSYPYTIVIDRGTALEDVMDVTSAAGLNLTVTRSVDGYTGQAHSINARVEHVTTARDYTEFQTKLDNTVNLTGNQTVAGVKTFSSSITASAGFLVPTSGTTSARVATLAAVPDWVGTFLNASFNGTGWVLDDTTKIGWFFKLDSRAAQQEFAVYKIPTGAGAHTDESAVLTINYSGLVTIAGRLTGVSSPSVGADAVNLTYANANYIGLAGDQTIAGIKTFSSAPVVPGLTINASNGLITIPFHLGGQVPVAIAAPKYVCPRAMTITLGYYRLNAGTMTPAVYKNGTNVAQGGSIGAGPVGGSWDFTDITCAVGDYIQLGATAADATAADFSLTLLATPT